VLVSAIPLIAFWGRYPDPIAVHWSAGGAPNGSMPLVWHFVVIVGGIVLAWGALVSSSFRRLPSSSVTAFVAFIMGLLAAVNAQILIFNLDAPSWEQADTMSIGWLIGVVAAGLAAAWIGWLLTGGAGGIPADVSIAPVVGSGESWSGSTSNLGMVVVAWLPLLLVLVVSPMLAPLLVAIGVVVVMFSSVTVGVDREALTISLGPFGRPRRRIPIGDITGAAAFDIRPMAYGGWGYRLSSGVRAYVIKGGEAIRVEIENHPDVLVTVEGAAEGAAVLDRLARGRSGDEDADRQQHGEDEL